jgi:hypothetical protein
MEFSKATFPSIFQTKSRFSFIKYGSRQYHLQSTVYFTDWSEFGVVAFGPYVYAYNVLFEKFQSFGLFM